MTLTLSGTDGLSDVDGSAATPAIRGTDANTGIFFPAADTIAFSEGGVEAMRIDSAGNVGIGVTPSAWNTYANNIQTPTGSIVSYSPSSNLGMVQNAYFSSGWKYSTTNAATFYLQSSGVHSWSYASSGTAGNAVTFTEAMRIDSSGNVGIGTASPSTYGQFAVYTAASNTEIAAVTGGANYATYRLQNSSRRYSMQIRTDQSNAWTLRDETAGANRLLVDTSGNFLFNSGYGSAATAYGCRAWVNFNGTGTVAIRGSANVSSITDNGTGAYTVNFSTAMVDANYCTNVTGTHDSGSYVSWGTVANDTPPTTSAVLTNFLNNAGSPTDVSFAQVSIIR